MVKHYGWGPAPETMRPPLSLLKSAIRDLEYGIEYAQEALNSHDTSHGRSTKRAQRKAETIENDIKNMKSTLADLEKYDK